MSLITIKDYEEYALNKLERGLCEYTFKGAQNDVTLKANEEAFKQIRIRPRYMVDVSKRDLSIKLFGQTLRMPVCVSPSGIHKRFHPRGELETAKGISDCQTLMIVSSGSTFSIEDIVEAEPDCVKWFQLFVYNNREITSDMIKRAEKLGFKAIVLTVDFPVIGLRYHNERNNYKDTIERVNYRKYGVNKDVAPDVTLDDIRLIKSQTNIPLILKGILTAEDARLAVECGVDGIMVSNHGGRQLDEVPATLEVLPEIVKEVGNEIHVYIDGGIRSGNDVFKALAMGAKAAFIARPVLYGLIHNGSSGVKSVLDIFYRELDTVMALSGCKTISDIKSSHIQHIDHYRNALKNF